MLNTLYKIALSSIVLNSTVIAQDKLDIVNGWGMYGSSNSISLNQISKESVSTIWNYNKNTKKWSAYSSDINILQKIKDSNIEILTELEANSGFWILGNSIDTIEIDNNLTNYVKILMPINQDLLENKSFTMFSYPMNHTDTKIVYFDNDSSSDFTITTFENKDINVSFTFNDLNKTITYNVANTGVSDDMKINYQIISQSNQGIILGNIDKNTLSNPNSLLFLQDNNFIENPIDMTTLLPYTYYTNTAGGVSSDNSHYTFDINNTKSHTSDQMQEINGTWISTGVQNINQDGNFTITNDGSLLTNYYSNTDTYGADSNHSIQVVASIGDFDILKNIHSGYTWKRTISYKDAHNDYQNLKLEDENITTWNQIFDMTNNIYEERTFSSNGTITFSGIDDYTYTISDNNTTLTSYIGDKESWNLTIKDYTIYSKLYNYEYNELVSTKSPNK